MAAEGQPQGLAVGEMTRGGLTAEGAERMTSLTVEVKVMIWIYPSVEGMTVEVIVRVWMNPSTVSTRRPVSATGALATGELADEALAMFWQERPKGAEKQQINHV
jgi:hypothetical protein